MLDRFGRFERHYAVKLIVPPAAVKDMVVMSGRDRDALIAKAEAFAADPFVPHSWAMPLSGEHDRIRIRQGDWRGVVLILRTRDTVILERVGHRREVYR
jgi:mRNA-degrading endonuclease RelE of RelBE toxin-antitoxin system